MTDQTYVLPVKRMGNDKNPKLVILLSNPGGGTRWPARLPEYVMKADGVYSDCGMDIETLRKYNEWWDDFFNVFQKHNIAPSDVLFLEYYPYHTVSSSDFDLNPKFCPVIYLYMRCQIIWD